MVQRVQVGANHLTLLISQPGILQVLQNDGTSIASTSPPTNTQPITIELPVRLLRIGQAGKMILASPGARSTTVNQTLVQLLAKAHDVHQRPLKSDHASLVAFATHAGMTASYITRLIRLVWLAPDITKAILAGTHPPALTTMQLMAGHPLPMDWPSQRTLLGFA